MQMIAQIENIYETEPEHSKITNSELSSNSMLAEFKNYRDSLAELNI